MPMIHTRLAGGLGNQLFQFAAAIALRGGTDSPLFLGTRYLSQYDTRRDFDLARLLNLPRWCEHDRDDNGQHRLRGRLMGLRIGRWLPALGVHDGNFEHHMHADARASGRPRTRWLDGYFQQTWDWGSFQRPLAHIRPMLSLSLPEPAAKGHDCVIHIRGGDFLAKPVHRVVDEHYYRRAVAALRVRVPNLARVLVVTDDPMHASSVVQAMAQESPDLHFEYSPAGGWADDFQLIRQARSRIIGNSTFSWWAAALDDARAPTIAPDRWIKHAPRRLVLPWETAIDVN